MLFLFVFPFNISKFFFFFQDAYFSAGTGHVYNVVEVALGCQILFKQRCSVVFGPSAEARAASGKRKEEMAGTGKIQFRLDLLNHNEQIC